MKNYITILFVLVAGIYKSQVYPSSCTAPDSIIKKYRDDADKLNIRRVYHINSTYKDSVHLDKEISENYMKALIAVYNATAIPARDTIINLYNIHPYNPVLNEIAILADSNVVWVKNLRNHVTPTGNTTLDQLMAKYYLHNVDIPYYPFINQSVELKTDTNCNPNPIADVIRTFSGVIAASNNDHVGSGNGSDVVDSITPNYTWLVYNIGWGDCNNGCIYKHYWGFRVYNDCSVEYGGSYGSPLYVGIKTNQLSLESIKTFPNPTSGKLTVAGLPERSTVTLINVLGKTVYSDSPPPGDTELDLGSYAAGIYYLKVKSRDGEQVIKVVKEN